MPDTEGEALPAGDQVSELDPDLFEGLLREALEVDTAATRPELSVAPWATVDPASRGLSGESPTADHASDAGGPWDMGASLGVHDAPLAHDLFHTEWWMTADTSLWQAAEPSAGCSAPEPRSFRSSDYPSPPLAEREDTMPDFERAVLEHGDPDDLQSLLSPLPVCVSPEDLRFLQPASGQAGPLSEAYHAETRSIDADPLWDFNFVVDPSLLPASSINPTGDEPFDASLTGANSSVELVWIEEIFEDPPAAHTIALQQTGAAAPCPASTHAGAMPSVPRYSAYSQPELRRLRPLLPSGPRPRPIAERTPSTVCGGVTSREPSLSVIASRSVLGATETRGGWEPFHRLPRQRTTPASRGPRRAPTPTPELRARWNENHRRSQARRRQIEESQRRARATDLDTYEEEAREREAVRQAQSARIHTRERDPRGHLLPVRADRACS